MKGEGLMRMQDETRRVKDGDSILIPARSWHSIENRGKVNLTILCICSPAFSKEETRVMNVR
jgi:mannose-6-phosphate isomerase-like protein (cupin superfamily)